MGICLGGHLAFRAALNQDVLAAACFYATDIDTGTLGKGDDSLKRAGEIKGELLTVWGRQDPHVPLDGRTLIRARLEEVGANFQWHEVNGQHAFLRDEGPRYDPAPPTAATTSRRRPGQCACTCSGRRRAAIRAFCCTRRLPDHRPDPADGGISWPPLRLGSRDCGCASLRRSSLPQ